MTEQPNPRVVIVGPDGSLQDARQTRPSADSGTPGGASEGSAQSDDAGSSIHDGISQPDKVMRIGTMIRQLLEEVRAAPLDDASRVRLREIHRSSVVELADGLSLELQEELNRLTLPFEEGRTPSDAELRIAQAQLVGWLEGLFHGLQTALLAQQMAARAQLEEMRRRALPPGATNPGDQLFGRGGAYL
jgi:hypothetical protein